VFSTGLLRRYGDCSPPWSALLFRPGFPPLASVSLAPALFSLCVKTTFLCPLAHNLEPVLAFSAVFHRLRVFLSNDLFWSFLFSYSRWLRRYLSPSLITADVYSPLPAVSLFWCTVASRAEACSAFEVSTSVYFFIVSQGRRCPGPFLGTSHAFWAYTR